MSLRFYLLGARKAAFGLGDISVVVEGKALKHVGFVVRREDPVMSLLVQPGFHAFDTMTVSFPAKGDVFAEMDAKGPGEKIQGWTRFRPIQGLDDAGIPVAVIIRPAFEGPDLLRRRGTIQRQVSATPGVRTERLTIDPRGVEVTGTLTVRGRPPLRFKTRAHP